MTSTGALDIERPDIRSAHTTSNGSFHSRALAVTAASRFRRPSTPRSQSDDQQNASRLNGIRAALSPPHSPRSPRSPRLAGLFSPKLKPRHAGDFEAGLGHRPMSTISSNSGEPVYSWLGGGGTGDEPGVDVKSRRDEEAWGHLTGPTNITVLDYTSDPEGKNVRVEFEGARLKEWLASEEAQRAPVTDEGETRPVRWIHVDGLNWDVVKTLTIEFGLHPLAVEDALRATNSPRSKLDFYKNHLYLQILVQHTHPGDEEVIAEEAENLSSWHLPGHEPQVLPEPESRASGYGSTSTTRRGSTALENAKQGGRRILQLPEGVEGVFEPTADVSRGSKRGRERSKNAHRLTVDELSAKYMVPIRRGIMCAFLTRDGTLITLTRKTIKEVLHPVYARLEDEQSLLRRSGDVSMLAQALLDVSVDLAIEISQTFETEILKLEASVLVDPSIDTVRHLHVLSSQLIRLRRSLTPLLHVAYIIRDQDAQRSAAASAMTTGPRPGDKNHGSRDSQWLAGSTPAEGHHSMPVPPTPMGMAPITTVTGPSRPGTPSIKSFANNAMTQAQGRSNSLNGLGMVGNNQGFFTPMTKVYIGDVLDHLEIIVSNMDQFVATCDHLTDYVFNVMSFQSNASMERLSIVTVVFLPLTFIASYFGMNFTEFPSLENPDSYFWKVAAPCTVGFFIIFSWTYIRLGAETIGRRIGRWRVLREVELRKGRKRD